MPFPGGTIYPGLTTFPSALAVALTPEPMGGPCPSVTVSISGLDGATMTVWRNALGSRTVVRGCKGLAIVGDTFEVTDYEAPFGVPVTYDVTAFTDTGVTKDSSTSDPDVLDVEDAWISDPLSPSMSSRVTLTGSSLGAATYRRPGGLVSLSGGSVPILVAGTRQVAAGVPVGFRCEDEAEEALIFAVLDSADPVLVRTPPGYRILPRLAYLTSDDWTLEIPPQGGGADAFSFIRGTGSLVAPPTPAVVVPTRTYANVAAEFSSYGDILAIDPPTYLKLLRG